jgi:hypothetical protein
MRLRAYVVADDMTETDRLWSTLCAWWPAIEVLVVTGATNARTEAATTGIKQIKRMGRPPERAQLLRPYLSRAVRRAG